MIDLSIQNRSNNFGIQPSLQSLIALREPAKRLRLIPYNKISTAYNGNYLSHFRGRGMEFEESRIYQTGDDPRVMDWRITARTGKLHVKLFREEKERSVWFLVDQGPSMRFGTRVAFKSFIASQVTAFLGWMINEHGDRVGGLVFDENNQIISRPATRGTGLLPLLEHLSNIKSIKTNGYANLNAAGEFFKNQIRSGSLIIIISDFITFQNKNINWLIQLARKNIILLILIYDQLETNIPPPNFYPIAIEKEYNSLIQSIKFLNLTNSINREYYKNLFTQRLQILQDLTKHISIHFFKIATHEPVIATLTKNISA